MPANKDPDTKGKWLCQFYYTDWTGERKKKRKRGFDTKHAAQEWEQEFIRKHSADINMTVSSFIDIYIEDISHRLRRSTLENKKHVLNSKIKPYFGSKPLSSIQPTDVRKWQNELIAEGYAPTYLKTTNNQLTALFNYAVKYYDLKENPCHKAGSMGKKKADSMQFWTSDEFKVFINHMEEKTVFDIGFRLLYYTGMRIGELLALTSDDIEFENAVININKSFQRIGKDDVITEPKTPKSKRVVMIPDELAAYIKEYFSLVYPAAPDVRIFEGYTKRHFESKLKKVCEVSGVKVIRLHDIRHSHASLLIEMGFSPLLIAERLGHESVETTLNTYAHLYPNKQTEVADKLGSVWF